MEVVILIVVLVVLILVHEFGHFVAAKLSGMRVDEFGIGYPPRAVVLFTKSETKYSLNWLPFGGFVTIFGEDGDEHSEPGSFGSKNRFLQACVLVAGVVMNFILAFVLITVSLWVGTPRVLESNEVAGAKDAVLTISDVLPGSPAEIKGLMAGDEVKQAIIGDSVFNSPDPEAFTQFVSGDTDGTPVTFDFIRSGDEEVISVIPETGVLPEDPARPALGVGLAVVGTVPVTPLRAVALGAAYTWDIVAMTAAGLVHFFATVFTFSADLSQVAGPVGIAGAVGAAAKSGLGSVISLAAVISVNLALINLIPVPALDGGRLLFVIIESIIRRKIPANVANAVNQVGFALLVLLMVVVTGHDVWKLIG